MSRPARKAARVKTRVNPSVLAASLLALVLLAVPAAVIANERPWAASDAETASASVPDPVASVTPTTEPTPEPTPQPTPEAKPKRKAQPVVGSGGKVVRGTTLVPEPSDGALERMLRRKAEALLRGEDGEPVEPAVPVEPVVPVEPLVPGAPVVPVVPDAPVEPVESTTFRVSSFNILGAAHTAPSGNRPEYARGVTRMRWAMSVLRSENVSVAGLQEFEHPQHAAFQQSAPGWDVFPGMTRGLSSLANSIVWRSDVWEPVRAHTIPIPYFNGNPKPMPYVLLRHVGTGREVWFANFHNPASTRGPAAHWRREAVRRESGLADRLAATGRPVILTGDMNDRAEFFCPMTATSQMHAANGGSRGAPCKPPANMRIDWIMGSADVDFSDYAVRDDALVDRTSDHPFIVSSVTIAR